MRQTEITKEIQRLQAINNANNARIRKLYAQYNKPQTLPLMYPFEYGDTCFSVDSRGEILEDRYREDAIYKRDLVGNRKHRMYPNRDYVVLMQRLEQEIADLLWLKWNYDKYYIPNWEDMSTKWFVVKEYTIGVHIYSVRHTISDKAAAGIYFSSESVAFKCAEWLNARAKYEGEQEGKID